LTTIALLVGLAFLIQWLAFIPSYWRQTEKFFDLTGSLTFLIISTLALFFESWGGWQSAPGLGAGCDLGYPPGYLLVQPRTKSGQG